MELPIVNREYEFDASQNSLIGTLANKMRFVAYVLIVLGVIEIIGGISILVSGNLEGIGSLIGGIVDLLIGVWTQNAAKSFKLVVDTEGRDIENMMGALGELRKLYSLQYWALIIAFVFGFVAAILAIVVGT